MSPRHDDDALSWDGDDDPTLDVGDTRRSQGGPVADAAAADGSEAAPAAVTLPDGYTAVGKGSELVEADAPATAPDPHAGDDAEDEPAGMGNAALIGLGVLGGIYLLYAIGWIVGGLRLQAKAGFLVDANGNASPAWSIGNAVALGLAAFAPILWFIVVYAMTRRSRPWLRWLLLVLGVVLLVPWPFVMMGAIGA